MENKKHDAPPVVSTGTSQHKVDWEEVMGTTAPSDPRAPATPESVQSPKDSVGSTEQFWDTWIKEELKQGPAIMRVKDRSCRFAEAYAASLRAQLQEQKENWDEEHSVMEEMLERSQRINAEKLAASEATIQRLREALERSTGCEQCYEHAEAALAQPEAGKE